MTRANEALKTALAVAQTTSHSSCVALVGQRGTGKSYCLGQLCVSLEARGYLRSSLAACLVSRGEGEDALNGTERRVVLVEYFSLVSDLEEGPFYGLAELALAQHTVLIVDQIELLDSLCQINGKTHLLQCLARLLLDSKGCTLVAAAEDESGIPFCFTESRSPIICKLSSFSSEEVRRLYKRLAMDITGCGPEVKTGASSCADVEVCKRSLLAALSLCLDSAKRGCDSAAAADVHGLFTRTLASFADRRGSFGAVARRVHLYGLESLAERLHILVQAFINLRQQTEGQRLLSESVSTTGVLLHGPSGCGKTALTQQLALAFPGVHFSFVSCSTLFSKYLGESEEKLRAVYQAARAKAPAVVVLDDVDVIAPSRGSLNDASGGKTGVDVSSRMLAGLLCELDGVTDNSGVLTICTTNAPHVIDVALLRQGRLETILCVPPLTVETAHEMALDFFAECSNGTETATRDMLAHYLSKRMKGCTPVSLKYMLRKILESQLCALRATNASVEVPQLPTEREIDALIEQHGEVINPVQYTTGF